jgi:hypothetical protein
VNASTEDIVNKVSQYIKSVEYDLSLHPPPPNIIISKEKKETLRNLYASSISEEMMAIDQLDLYVQIMLG